MPTTSPKERRRRCIIIEMILGMHGKFIDLSDDTSTTLVMMAIRLGAYQKRPMDITGLAGVTNLPRTTVIRHVKALEGLGRIKVVSAGRRTIPILSVGSERPNVEDFYRDLERLIISAGSNLSKMDTFTDRHNP